MEMLLSKLKALRGKCDEAIKIVDEENKLLRRLQDIREAKSRCKDGIDSLCVHVHLNASESTSLDRLPCIVKTDILNKQVLEGASPAQEETSSQELVETKVEDEHKPEPELEPNTSSVYMDNGICYTKFKLLGGSCKAVEGTAGKKLYQVIIGDKVYNNPDQRGFEVKLLCAVVLIDLVEFMSEHKIDIIGNDNLAPLRRMRKDYDSWKNNPNRPDRSTLIDVFKGELSGGSNVGYRCIYYAAKWIGIMLPEHRHTVILKLV